VRKAFPGLLVGEQEVTHLLCKVYSHRNLDKCLAGPANQAAKQHLLAALYHRRTRLSCEESIESAIRAAPAAKKEYIRKECWNTRSDWANFNRCHSMLLLQVPSTNSVESWHASLKHGVKAAMAKWSLSGLIQHIANCAEQWDRKALRIQAEFRTRHLSDTIFFPGLRKFPFPVQKLCLGQLKIAQERMGDGDNCNTLTDEVSCTCLFFRKYSLPCACLWHQELTFGAVFTEHTWERWAFMFEDCGFEIYESMGVTYLNREIYEEVGAPARRRLEVCLLLV
jgi:hypothetical protein